MLTIVYGTLKRGFRLNYRLQNSKYIEDITLKDYTLFHNGAYPFAVPRQDGFIMGELWDVSEGDAPVIHSIESFAYDLKEVTHFNSHPVYMWVWRDKIPGDFFGTHEWTNNHAIYP